jgi:FkbM family methyltransferase
MNSSPFQRRWSEQATADDVYYCYRLLLKREPHADELKFWGERLANESFTISKLAACFCESHEYLTSKKARGIKMVSLDDFELFVFEHDWDIGAKMLREREYEPHVTAFLKKKLKPGLTFVDVGANVGYFTVLAGKLLGRSGRGIAIECNPKNCELICLNLYHNRITNTMLYPFAVTDAQKLLSLSAGFTNRAVDELRDEDAAIVPAVTLDFLLKNEPRIDIIKMDVEGSEGKAWRGMSEIINRHHPRIVMEYFPALLEKRSSVGGTDFLDDIFSEGYTAAVLRSEGNPVRASNSSAIVEMWQQHCDNVGDESRAYLDLVWQFPAHKRVSGLIRRLITRSE